ncbi:MAG TPA: hypothetical protein DIW47_09030 [Bacteroidetes bacterium]|nr:hypothetical protein [Bacteroidota bacterium]
MSLIIFNSCRKRDIEDPAYMHITAIEQAGNPGQGTKRHDIQHVYTLIADNSIGTYQAPATVPVLHEGNVLVEARPMIRWFAREGLHPYSMMKNYSQMLDFVPLTVDTLKPVFEYQDNVEFAWMEDFNDNSASMQLRSGTFDSFYVKNEVEHSLDGSPYMLIDMGNGEQFFEIESQDLFDLPVDGREVILEIDYKTNVAFTIGLYATNPSQVVSLPSVTPYSTEKSWRKGYVYLTDEVFNQGSTTRFRIFFRSVNKEVIDPKIYIDNLKLLYRKG